LDAKNILEFVFLVGGEFCCGDRLWWTIFQLVSLLVQADGDLSTDCAGVWTLEIINGDNFGPIRNRFDKQTSDLGRQQPRATAAVI